MVKREVGLLFKKDTNSLYSLLLEDGIKIETPSLVSFIFSFEIVSFDLDYSPSGCSVHGISVVGWPFPSQGDLPNPEIKPVSPALQDEFFFHC